MSRLRILEEEKRRSKSMPWSKREKVLERLLKLLYEHREILLAVAHGGFVNSNIFRDVDIAVYTKCVISYNDEPLYVDKLKESLEKEVNLPIDVQLLDYAPPAFKLAALRGKLLFEKINGLRAILRIHAAEELEALRFKRKLLNA
ncbi:MAG: nucleotidyltransferase domain-containing protein [Thermoproteota archaeon]